MKKTLILITLLTFVGQSFVSAQGIKSYYKVSDIYGGFTGTIDNSDLFGFEVEGIGDLDGDGIADVAVNAYSDDDGYTDAGAVWILFLNLDGSVKSHQKIAHNTGGLGAELGSVDVFGNAIENIGDLNGDGVTDLAVGAMYDDDGGTDRGCIYILFMKTDGTVDTYQKISDTQGNFNGTLATYDSFGTSIANLEDIDGDGINDLAVGAWADNDGGTKHGAVWVLFMNTDGTVRTEQKISSLAGNFTGTLDVDDRFGYGVECIGDLNGDEVNDMVVGAIYDDDESTNAGAVWVLFLNPNGSVASHQKISMDYGDLSTYVTLTGSDLFGISNQYMGDHNGNGDVNLMVASRNDDDGGTDQGAVYILDLGTDGKVNGSQKISDLTTGFTTELNASDYFGSSVSKIGDINNDGVVEYIIGATLDDDGGTNRGAFYEMTFNGPTTETPYVTNLSFIADGEGGFPTGLLDNSDLLGYAAEGIGDLDGDGIEDLAVNAYLDDEGSTNAGAVWILFLNANGSVKSYKKIASGINGFEEELGNTDVFGCSIENIGDLDGDGTTDLAVGAMYDDDGGTDRGCIYILFMKTDGTVDSYQKISDTAGSFTGTLATYDAFGTSIANLGDMDGDGINDLAVGAWADNDGGTKRGAVWVLFMNTNGTVDTYQKISDTAGSFTGVLDNDDRFGFGVECIGDLDADGINDIVVGAIYDDDGNDNTGALWILFLNANGTVSSYQKISDTAGNFEGILNRSDQFGFLSEYMGDIDGDGYPTLFVSARSDDGDGTDKGAVWALDLNTDGTVKTYKKISDIQGGFSESLSNADFFGAGIAKIGDINSDGFIEFAIGAYGNDQGGTDRGAIYIMSLNGQPVPAVIPTESIVHNSAADSTRNWSYSENYDENGVKIGASKQYVDELGRGTQSLTLNVEKNKVLATQTVFDQYGRPVLNTMPAPVGTGMGYREYFITNVNGDDYNYLDFDKRLTLNNPGAVQNTNVNTLGNYYSDNGEEDYVATSSFPFSRVEYMADPTGRVKRSAAPGENFKMGSKHESRAFYMLTGGELDRAFGVDSTFYCQTDSATRLESKSVGAKELVASKTISVDAEGKIAISFVSDGLTIASCVSGMTSTVTEQTVENSMLYAGTQSVDIHLPEAKSTSLTMPLPSYEIPEGSEANGLIAASEIVFKIMDLETNLELMEGVDYTINSGTRVVTFMGNNKHRFLRISFEYTAAKIAYLEGEGAIPPNDTINYKLDYSHFTANYYDLAGRLKMNISPKGFDYSVNGKHTEFSKYDYDNFGHIIAKSTPDEGLMEYLYSDEGVVRFSQNAQQEVDNKFSYVRYDEYNRSIESGEYQENGAGFFEFANYYDTASTGDDVKTIIDDVDSVFSSQTAHENYIAYDLLASADQVDTNYSYWNQYPQHNLKARVSKTWNANNQTWFSYDYAGRPEYTVQEIIDTDFSTTKDETVKTVEYTYAPLTSVLLKEEFQKNHTTEKLTHEYSYNGNLQLDTARAIDDNGTTVGEATFDYYINGQLKRKEIDVDLQGIDYTYTLHGQLKTINHPSLYDAYDPGQDGKAGTVNASFDADVFGMALDYYQDDYVRAGTNIISSVTTASGGYNNGLIKANRWRIRDENLITKSSTYDTLYYESDIDKELMYNYTYDDFYRFETANFGVFDNDATSSAFTSQSDFKVFGTSGNTGIDYDIIGNITQLKRNGVNDGQLLMDNLDYTYTAGTSQLASILDNETTTIATDFETSGTDNFTYNSLGQMTDSDADSVDIIVYKPNGQVEKVTFDNGNTAEYFYNERNIKIKSKFIDIGASFTKYNWYITDASGALKNVHEKTTGSVTLTNQAIYGGGRLGMLDKITDKMNYELTDYLGNVRATVSRDGSNNLEVISWADYYPFGEVLPGRNSNPTGMFGYQGQERISNATNEVSGSRWYNFNLRMYNPSLGRFNTIDPYSQFHSPYLAMANNPISFVDPDGGRALLTTNQRLEIHRHLFLNKHLYSRRDWLARIIANTSGGMWMGMLTLEGFDARVRLFGIDGVNQYMEGIGGGFKDGAGGPANPGLPYDMETSQDMIDQENAMMFAELNQWSNEMYKEYVQDGLLEAQSEYRKEKAKTKAENKKAKQKKKTQKKQSDPNTTPDGVLPGMDAGGPAIASLKPGYGVLQNTEDKTRVYANNETPFFPGQIHDQEVEVFPNTRIDFDAKGNPDRFVFIGLNGELLGKVNNGNSFRNHSKYNLGFLYQNNPSYFENNNRIIVRAIGGKIDPTAFEYNILNGRAIGDPKIYNPQGHFTKTFDDIDY